jgi:peptide/nickel transport system permease protein
MMSPATSTVLTPAARLRAEFFASRLAVVGLILVLLVTTCAVLAPLISPQNPYDLAKVFIEDSKLPPMSKLQDGRTALLGTDDQGRDMLSAIFYGLRISLLVGVLSTVFAMTIGLAIGLVAAYRGGRIDSLIMRVVDIQLSFPAILIALILLALLGQGVGKTIFALVTVQWAYYARTVRSAALAERAKEYMEAAHLLQLPTWRIIFKHLLPNCLPPVIVVASVQVAHAIALEATLSYLGIGVPITEPSLGLLIKNGFDHMLSGKTWISMYPGIALLLTIVGINLVADRLRDVLNPKLKR